MILKTSSTAQNPKTPKPQNPSVIRQMGQNQSSEYEQVPMDQLLKQANDENLTEMYLKQLSKVTGDQVSSVPAFHARDKKSQAYLHVVYQPEHHENISQRFENEQIILFELLFTELLGIVNHLKNEIDVRTSLDKLAAFMSSNRRLQSQREHDRICFKMISTKRFLLSHLKNLYINKPKVLAEVNHMLRAYIGNYIKEQADKFQEILSQGQNNLRYDFDLDINQIQEDEPFIFELQFNIKYTKFDMVSVPIWTYVRPKKSEEQEKLLSPREKQTKREYGQDKENEIKSIFIARLTSDFLIQATKKAIEKSYNAKKFQDQNKFKLISISAIQGASECVDYQLSIGKSRLVDFLYSATNTNGKASQKQNSIKEVLFDQHPLRHSRTIHFQSAQEELELKCNFISKINKKRVSKLESKKKVTIKDYDLIKVLGEGAFAKVVLARAKSNGKLYAMKVIHKNKIKMEAGEEYHIDGEKLTTEEVEYRNMYRVKQIMSERSIFSQLNKSPSPFIVQLHQAFTSKNYLYFVLDLCPGGDLFSLVQKHRSFRPEQARLLFCEVLLAVEHLHKNNILYRDLKPENILVDEVGSLKLTDFGLSKPNFSDSDRTDTICGSPEYFCPELLLEQKYGRTLDFYSLGVLLYELLTGMPPFYSNDQDQMQYDIVNMDPITLGLSGDCLSLIKGLLEKDPEKRLGVQNGIKDIKSHTYFKDIDWDDIYHKRYKYEKMTYLKIEYVNTNFQREQDESISFSDDEGQSEKLQEPLSPELFERVPDLFCAQIFDDIVERKRSSSFHEIKNSILDNDSNNYSPVKLKTNQVKNEISLLSHSMFKQRQSQRNARFVSPKNESKMQKRVTMFAANKARFLIDTSQDKQQDEAYDLLLKQFNSNGSHSKSRAVPVHVEELRGGTQEMKIRDVIASPKSGKNAFDGFSYIQQSEVGGNSFVQSNSIAMQDRALMQSTTLLRKGADSRAPLNASINLVEDNRLSKITVDFQPGSGTKRISDLIGSQDADIQEEDDDDEEIFEEAVTANQERLPSVYVLNANSNMKSSRFKDLKQPEDVPKEFRNDQARSTGSFSNSPNLINFDQLTQHQRPSFTMHAKKSTKQMRPRRSSVGALSKTDTVETSQLKRASRMLVNNVINMLAWGGESINKKDQSGSKRKNNGIAIVVEEESSSSESHGSVKYEMTSEFSSSGSNKSSKSKSERAALDSDDEQLTPRRNYSSMNRNSLNEAASLLNVIDQLKDKLPSARVSVLNQNMMASDGPKRQRANAATTSQKEQSPGLGDDKPFESHRQFQLDKIEEEKSVSLTQQSLQVSAKQGRESQQSYMGSQRSQRSQNTDRQLSQQASSRRLAQNSGTGIIANSSYLNQVKAKYSRRQSEYQGVKRLKTPSPNIMQSQSPKSKPAFRRVALASENVSSKKKKAVHLEVNTGNMSKLSEPEMNQSQVSAQSRNMTMAQIPHASTASILSKNKKTFGPGKNGYSATLRPTFALKDKVELKVKCDLIEPQNFQAPAQSIPITQTVPSIPTETSPQPHKEPLSGLLSDNGQHQKHLHTNSMKNEPVQHKALKLADRIHQQSLKDSLQSSSGLLQVPEMDVSQISVPLKKQIQVNIQPVKRATVLKNNFGKMSHLNSTNALPSMMSTHEMTTPRHMRSYVTNKSEQSNTLKSVSSKKPPALKKPFSEMKKSPALFRAASKKLGSPKKNKSFMSNKGLVSLDSATLRVKKPLPSKSFSQIPSSVQQ